MGYTAPRREYPLDLGEEFHGLEVTVTGVSIAKYLRLAGFTADDVPVSEAIEAFRDNLIAWNLEEDDGTPIPIEAAGDQDKDLILALTTAWVSSLHGVPVPLEPSSPAGEPSLVAQIPMDVPSPSQAA
jgi:hypothetical protein